MGVQRQSLPSQPHRQSLSEADKAKRKLLTWEDFKITGGVRPALPPDIVDDALVNRFRKQFLDKIDNVDSFWTNRFRAKDVTRVPLKLPRTENEYLCIRCQVSRCSCFIQGILDSQENETGSNLAHSVHMSDHVSGSPDGLLNFFPSDLKPFNIGSKNGLARILAEFNIDNSDKNMFKIVNTDVQIYERIIKVKFVSRICY